MMTIDEAIKHAEEVAELNEAECFECAEEHRQLAEWLKELKRVREQPWLKELKRLREQKRHHGKWKACEDTSYCKCSRCSTVVMLEETYIFHFCPWCGASMVANDEQVTGKLKEGDPDDRA